MKRTIELVASFSGKINTGGYEQNSPFYSLKEVLEDVNGEATDEFIVARQRSLEKLCYDRYKECEAKVRMALIKDKVEQVGFYEINGEKYFRVTGILNFLYPINFPKEKLEVYALNGTLHHKVAEHFFKTGEWLKVKEQPEFLKVMNNEAGVKLDPESVSFEGYWSKFGHDFEIKACEMQVMNTAERYAGTLDLIGLYDGKPSIIDIKTGKVTKQKAERYWKQLSAYSLCDGVDVGQLVILPIAEMKEPIVCEDIKRFQNEWLEDLRKFRREIGI